MNKIHLFVTCLVDVFFPEVGESTVECLNKAGYEVLFDDHQTCCGQPAFNAGYWQDAKRIAIHFLDVYESHSEPIVIPSGSCAAMIRHGYLELFKSDPENLRRAQTIAARTFELSEFLTTLPALKPYTKTIHPKVAYHPSCHLLRQLGIDTQPKQLLSNNNVDFVSLEPECCGFGGVFSIDQPEISSAMLERKIQAIEATKTNLVVACDVSCLMHIEGGSRHLGKNIQCSHLAQILTGKKPGLR
jgi:L-lactate dehydrogenase complex protein LldE